MEGTIQSVEAAFDRLADGAVWHLGSKDGGGPPWYRCVIRKHTLWQAVRNDWKNRRIPAHELPTYVVTRNGTVWLRAYDDEGDPDKGEGVWPGIVSERMRRELYEAVRRRHAEVYAVQATYEIVGTLKMSPGATEVSLEVCPNDDATQYSSEPLCNFQRRCKYNLRHPAMGGHVIGEFHSHPAPSGKGYIRPHSDSDLYQLALAAAQGVHAYSVVVSKEGDYHAHATRTAGQRLMHDLAVYYRDHNQSAGRTEWALSECRQPDRDHVKRQRTPYLWLLLVGSGERYFDLMDGYDREKKNQFIAAYTDWVWENLHIAIHFVPAEK